MSLFCVEEEEYTHWVLWLQVTKGTIKSVTCIWISSVRYLIDPYHSLMCHHDIAVRLDSWKVLPLDVTMH